MNLKKQAIQGLSWSFLIQFGVQAINFIVSIILARILIPADFGLIGMIGIFVIVGKSLVDGGMSSSLIRTKNPNQADYSTVFYMNLIVSFSIYFVLYFLAPHIADFFDQNKLINIIRVLCTVFIIDAFSTVQSTILNKSLKFKTQFVLIMPALIISCSLGVWMAYNGFGVWSLVWKDLTFAVIATVQLWIYSKWVPSIVFDKAKLKYHFSFGYKLTLSNMINRVFENIYYVIIGKYFSASQLGFYSRAKTLQELPTNYLFLGFNRVSFPLLSKINDNDNDTKLKSIYKRLMIQVIFWNTPILIILGVLAQPLFRFMLTEKWLSAVPYFQVLVIAGVISPLHRYNLNICYVKGRSDIVLKSSVFQNILTIIGAFMAIWFGIYGLLWSIVFVNLIIAIVNANYSGRLINYSIMEQLKDITPIIIIGVFTGVITYWIDYILIIGEYSDFIRLLISSIVGIVSYLILSYITKSPAIREIILIAQPIIEKIKKKTIKR